MLIGRKEEQTSLWDAYNSEESEFVAVYGRRRVGKTFLVRETFGDKFSFYHSGLANSTMEEQLKNFWLSLKQYGYKGEQPASWLDAFYELGRLLSRRKMKRKVVFIDELPWMDTPKSKFLPAFEHFWNGWASARNDILLIICGSATSWIVRKVFHNHGGLHNRVTYRIPLKPFSLYECEQFSKHKSLGFNRRQIAEAYMALGGIPYYWKSLTKGLSVAQNFDKLFFAEDAIMKNEFQELYASLFKNEEHYIKIVQALGTRKAGMTRDEIIKNTGIDGSGAFSSYLADLEQSGFIRKYNVFGRKTKGALWQLIDNYTLFYFSFIANRTGNDENFWTRSINTPAYNVWCGLSFERVCLQHIRQIKLGLSIAGTVSDVYAWRTMSGDGHLGAQIDMVIDRNDKVINLCEMKYSEYEYSLTADDISNLINKKKAFVSETKTRKAVQFTMITSCGLAHNQYSNNIHSELVLEDLFKE
ncbi:MAG: ATP-binding protein [Bacteroidales bacterium]|nr:ATP-binding protein [Bacteroidales bacterium]